MHPHDREILRLGLPALATLIAEPLYILVDTAVVGRLGTEELGGLAIAGSLLVTAYSLFIFLAYGTTARVARLIGAGDRARATHEGVQAMWLALMIGAALGVVVFALSDVLVSLMGGSGEVASHALTYLRVSTAGLPFLLGSLAGTGHLRGLQDARTPLLVVVATNVLNLVVEVVLIFGLDYGVGASAFATVLAQATGFGVFAWIVLRDAHRHRIGLRPHGRSLRGLARVGLDLFVRTVSLRIALLGATAIAARIGAVQLAAHHIAFELWNFLALALDAVAIAAQSIVGRLLGGGEATQARAAARRMVAWSVAGGAMLGLAVAALNGILPGLFTQDAAVIAATGSLLWFVAVMQPVNAVAFALDGILIGAGDARFLARAMAFATAMFLLAAAVVVMTDGGLGALWTALAVFMVARAAPLWMRLRSGRWAVTGARIGS